MSGSGDFSTEVMRVVGLGLVQGRFQGGARRLHDSLSTFLRDEAEQIATIARARIGALFKNPSVMQAAVQTGAAEDIGGSAALTEVGISATGLPYLRIHEYGGVIMTPDITAYMSFAASRWKAYLGDQSQLHFQHTAAHITVIPERSYLRYALEERREAIRAGFAELGVGSLR